MGFLAATSEPDNFGRESRPPAGFGPIGRASIMRTPLPLLYASFGELDSDNRKRAFAVEGIPTGLAYPSLAGLFDACLLLLFLPAFSIFFFFWLPLSFYYI